jgi:hypothetical protein
MVHHPRTVGKHAGLGRQEGDSEKVNRRQQRKRRKKITFLFSQFPLFPPVQQIGLASERTALSPQKQGDGRRVVTKVLQRPRPAGGMLFLGNKLQKENHT